MIPKAVKLLNSTRSLAVLLGLLLLLQLILMKFSSDEPAAKKTAPRASIDTFVPLGYQLIPIQITNQEEISSLINDFAIVDLLAPGRKSPVLRSTRLIRSPNNPSVFAVLVPQDQSPLVLSADQNFYVALRNPKQIAEKSQSQSRRIFLED